MAHSVPENMAPTLAKLRPEEMEERYMSRRPARSCCLRGRSVIGTVPATPGLGRVAAAEVDVEASVVAETEFTLLVAMVEGFTPAVAEAPVAAVVG